MFIFVPIGGKGERFKKNNYKKPKALIDVNNKPILFYLLENIKNIDFIYIVYQGEYSDYNFEDLIKNNFNHNFKFLKIDESRGAAETINIGLMELEVKDQPVLCLDCDNFYLNDIVKDWKGENKIFVIENDDPKFSYIQTDKEYITDIKEKQVISNLACTGAYGFSSYKQLLEYTDRIIKDNKRYNNEFYTSLVVKEMLNHKFKYHLIKNKDYFTLGTPESVKQYETCLLFDLDGTMVNSDDIYCNVWNKILFEKYNISVDKFFFDNFIKGLDDKSFLTSLFEDISEEEIKDISEIKDKLFIEELRDTDRDILVDGLRNFIKNNSNCRMCVVTSSNKSSAIYILEKYKLIDNFQFVISSNCCNLLKPNPEPYNIAINRLDVDPENCIIFEDSNSGYKSAKQSGVKNICLVLNEHTTDYIKKSNNIKIEDYNNITVDEIKSYGHVKRDRLLTIIKDEINFLPIKNVRFSEENLKTGYICDIKLVNLIYNNESEENIVVKISNNNNELSKTAEKLNLYENEIFFYKQLSNIINIRSPKFYKDIYFDDKSAIILEDMNKYSGKFNINLNNDINVLLKLVRRISEMHNRFYFIDNINSPFDKLKTNRDNSFIRELVNERYDYFIKKNRIFFNDKILDIFNNIYNNFDKIINESSTLPLSLCHGDLKSPNIFYLNNEEPIFLDWQYVQLNKGISDIAFLLVESVDFDKDKYDFILKYYYYQSNYKSFDNLLHDFKNSLCIFPFFVAVWFNTENNQNLLDKVFPIKFLKKLIRVYDYYNPLI